MEQYARGPCAYFVSRENFIQLFIIVASFCFIFLAPINIELATHFAAWALFAAWIDMTSYLGRFGFLGGYVYMVFNVTEVLLKRLIVYVPTLIGFAFGFSMLMHANPAF